MSKTTVTNICGTPVSLPAPYSCMLPAGEAACISDTPANIIAALGGIQFVQGVLQFEDAPSGAPVTPHNTPAGATLPAASQPEATLINAANTRIGLVTPITTTATDRVVVCKLTSPGAVAVNLHASPATGDRVSIIDGTGDAGSNNITVTPAAGLINGSATLVISTNYGRADLVYSGSAWLSVGVLPTSATTTTATDVAETRTGHVRYNAPIAAELVSVVNAVTPTNVALTLAAQPDYPRNLQVRVVIDTTHAITAGNLAIVGKDASGKTITENVSLITASSVTLQTTHAFSHVTSATVSAIAITGGAGSTTVGIGVGKVFGLPANGALTSSTFAVYKENLDNADEVVGTVDATNGTIAATTDPNATHNFDFFYSYAVTPTQNSHTHTLA